VKRVWLLGAIGGCLLIPGAILQWSNRGAEVAYRWVATQSKQAPGLGLEGPSGSVALYYFGWSLVAAGALLGVAAIALALLRLRSSLPSSA
jgi:hypothetical protein